ncbi:MAG: hypothetical protein ACKVQA_09755 [Burkholderiales bacterium]
MRTLHTLRIAALAAMFSASFLATAADEAFDKLCAMGLALGEKIPTDCSVNWKNPADGKVYCFSGEGSKKMFLETPAVHLKKAHAEFGRR